jgi:hypothetical protein
LLRTRYAVRHARRGPGRTAKMLQLATVALLWMRLDLVTSAQVPWSVRLPITIEVKQDVEILTWDYKRPEARGTLYLALVDATGFRLRRGQRFQVIKIEGEGQCWIRVLGKKYLLMSCPWFEDYRDHQSDIFEVVTSTPRRKDKP